MQPRSTLTSVVTLIFLYLCVCAIEQAFATAFGTNLGFSCTQDHTSVCVTSATVRVQTDESQQELKATFYAQSTGRTCLTASLNVRVDDQLVYTTPILSAGSTVSKISLGTFAPGIHTVNVTEASFDASSCAYPENGSNNMYDISIGLYPDTANTRTFSATSGTAAIIGQMVSFAGQGWNKKGAPIKVSWNGKLVKSFPAAAKFRGHFKLWDFPTKDLATCQGPLVARQGSVAETVTLQDTADRYVYLASGILRGDHKEVRADTVLCSGAEPHKESAHFWVWKSNLSNVRLPGLSIDDTISRVQATNVFAGPSGRIILARKGTSKVINVYPEIGPTLLTDLPSFDPKSLEGVVGEIPNNPAGDLKIDTFARAVGDVLIDGNLELDNGYLFVDGALSINGSVSGRGALVATGNIILHGPVDLVPAGGRNPLGSFSLLAGGELVLGHQK